MNRDQITIGIDFQDGTYFVARVDTHTGRPDIKALVRFDADHFNGHHLLEGNRIVISIPDNETKVKYFHLPNSEKAIEKVSFELETAQIEQADNFLFDIIPTSLTNYYLGLTVRKELAQKLVNPFVIQNGDLSFSTGGVMRAVALARGFLSFCQQSGGEFGAIVDFGTTSASLAIYYKQQIIDVTGLPLAQSYSVDTVSFQKAIIELKTLLNYKIALLLDKGISIPLSKIYLIGSSLTAENLESIHQILKIQIDQPKIHTGFITDRNKSLEIPLDKYLVALGLTVNKS